MDPVSDQTLPSLHISVYPYTVLTNRSDVICRSCVILDVVSELVSTEEAAKAVGLAYRTLLRYAKRGQVTPAQALPTGQFRWDIASLRRQLGMQPEDSK